jgi:hypothetical protein
MLVSETIDPAVQSYTINDCWIKSREIISADVVCDKISDEKSGIIPGKKGVGEVIHGGEIRGKRGLFWVRVGLGCIVGKDPLGAGQGGLPLKWFKRFKPFKPFKPFHFCGSIPSQLLSRNPFSTTLSSKTPSPFRKVNTTTN